MNRAPDLMMMFDCGPGADLAGVAAQLLGLANSYMMRCGTEYNDATLEAKPGDTVEAIVARHKRLSAIWNPTKGE